MLYTVTVELGRTVLVEASDRGEAESLALRQVAAQFPEHPYEDLLETTTCHVWPADDALVERVRQGLAKPESVRCPRCFEVSEKAAWGPGFVRCPRCERFLPTPDELRAAGQPIEVFLEKCRADLNGVLGMTVEVNAIPDLVESFRQFEQVYTYQRCGFLETIDEPTATARAGLTSRPEFFDPALGRTLKALECPTCPDGSMVELATPGHFSCRACKTHVQT